MNYSNYKLKLSTLDWVNFSDALRKKANYKCQACGGNKKLQSHHMTYEYCNTSLEWLSIMVLCGECHESYHKVFTIPPLKSINRKENIDHHLEVLKARGIDVSYGESLPHNDWIDEPVMSLNNYSNRTFTMSDVERDLKSKGLISKMIDIREKGFDVEKCITANKDRPTFFKHLFDINKDVDWMLHSKYKFHIPRIRPHNWRILLINEANKQYKEGKLEPFN